MTRGHAFCPWVAFSGYSANTKLFETKDGGETWTNLSEGLPNLPVNTIAPRSTSNGLFVGLDVGVYYRDDNLNRWVPYYTNLPRVVIRQLTIDQPRNRMFAATFGRGVWVTEIPAAP